jgi:hypothetical protein
MLKRSGWRILMSLLVAGACLTAFGASDPFYWQRLGCVDTCGEGIDESWAEVMSGGSIGRTHRSLLSLENGCTSCSDLASSECLEVCEWTDWGSGDERCRELTLRLAMHLY